MSYVPVESDDRADGGLEFQSFESGAGNSRAPPNQGATPNTRSGNSAGYFVDAPARPAGGFWTVEYYQQYFDVDTKTVMKRCYTTLMPTSANYLSTHLTPTADLYGPFWTLSTLIFALFLSSSLASSITSYLSKSPEPTEYDFQLLSIAVSLVYAYGLGFPVVLWLALRYMGIGEWSMVEAVAVWGYGHFIWIPVAILCVIPSAIARWVLTGVGFGVSGWFLGANLYPILATSEHKWSRGLIVLVAALHAGIAFTFKFMFFSYYIVNLGPKDPTGETPNSPAATVTAIVTASSRAMVARTLGVSV